MKLSKKMSLTLAAGMVALAMSVVPVLASTSLSFYDIAYNGQSSLFTATNADNVLTIKGWQTTYDNAHPAYEQYTIYQYSMWGDTIVGSTRITGNIPKSGGAPWYSYTFNGVSPGYQYYIVWGDLSGAKAVNGQGNVYDGK